LSRQLPYVVVRCWRCPLKKDAPWLLTDGRSPRRSLIKWF
jgi:hypothetical protein